MSRSKKLNTALVLLAVLLSLIFLLSLSCVDQTMGTDIGLWDKVKALETRLAKVPPYINIDSITQEYLTMTLSTQGDYPVIATLYGSGLTAEIVKPTSLDYNIVKEYLHSSHMLTVIVEPVVMWQNSDIIKLSLKDFYSVGGIVEYATVSCGG